MNRHSPARRAAASTLAVLVVLVLLVVVAAGWWLKRGGGDGVAVAPDRHQVERTSFDITVLASGELAALTQTEIASQLEIRATITEIVDEGVWVNRGDLLIQLDDEEIRNRIKDVEVAVKNAETGLQTAQSDLQIRRDTAASDLSLADVDVRLALLAIRAWEEGHDVSQRQQLALEVETTKKDYDRLIARFAASADLLAQEFISQDEFDRDEIEMIRAKSRYEQAELALRVYEEFQREQDIEKLRADLKKMQDKRTETAQRSANEITTLETAVENREVALNRERERLAKARAQLERCRIIAPQDGLVVYASSLSTGRHGRNEQSPPQVGTELARNRTVMILPDTSQMVAEVKVNEALSGRIKAGQSALVHSDAVPDESLAGTVIGVGVLAESGGWRDPLRRDYTVRIKLDDGNSMGLKPSMRCRANIYVDRVDDVLAVPVAAVHHAGRESYVYTPDGSGFAQRAVSTGRASEFLVEIHEGLAEGDVVLLREPAREQITQRLERETPGSDAVAQRSGRPQGSAANATPTGQRPQGAAQRPSGETTRRRGKRASSS
ncbi:MAG: HlyD family efflux transporter periplasmic adaptor subunit [Phycisphaerales bacterium]|nr:HlyD family efflux transporter periplasmic adaptor subunit [Phycisphaerae bacterium]NNF43423.1 HlyD family efflux transporter periplasmic adaptor subunit [Phycisphaerales bacterium]NNM24955.1 HlyD family efflux transporter periplasmic adaptor subunit [Phycisphaerales bacterium]